MRLTCIYVGADWLGVRFINGKLDTEMVKDILKCNDIRSIDVIVGGNNYKVLCTSDGLASSQNEPTVLTHDGKALVHGRILICKDVNGDGSITIQDMETIKKNSIIITDETGVHFWLAIKTD